MSAVLSATEPARPHGNHEDAEYDAFLGRLNARFNAAATRHGALPVDRQPWPVDAWIAPTPPAQAELFTGCQA